MSARIVPWLGRLLAIAALVACALSSAVALSVDDAFVPTDGTFRDALSMSRHERASLLAQRLRGVGHDDADFARQQVRELSAELRALGIGVRNLDQPAAQWEIDRGASIPDDFERAQVTGSWTWDRMTAVDAFWTDPSSPALLYTRVTESSGRPRVAPPHVDRVNLLADWSPPAARDDFMQSSPEAVLPANARIALHPGLALDFAFTPHPRIPEPTLPRVVDSDSPAAILPSTAVTLDTLARIGMSGEPTVNVPGSAASPLMQGGPVAVRTPALAMSTPGEAVYGPRFTPAARPRWRVSGGYQSSPVFGDTRAAELFNTYDGSRAFLTGLDPVGPGTAWTHYAAGAGYRLPVQDVDVNVKFDEWTFGGPNAGPALTGIRSFGLDGMRLQDARLDVNLNLDPSLSLHGGYIYTRTSGLRTSFDPISSNVNITEDRAFPYLGFDYKISNNARWNVNIRFYNTPFDLSTPSTRSTLNLTDPQVTTEVKVRF